MDQRRIALAAYCVKRIIAGGAILCFIYLAAPLALFDFTQSAVPRDEENFGMKQVAIGPMPRPWFAQYVAADLDIPGGWGYDADGWAFVVWKPLCVWHVKRNGYALPSEWR
jgi:hypothetical protein